MGNALAADTIPVLVTLVDVHNPRCQDQFYFCNVSSGGAATKVIGRSQTLSVEVGITTIISLIVYECPEPVFTPEMARCLGLLRIPIERLAERYSSGVFQQWFNLDVRTDPRAPAGDPHHVATLFEQAYTEAVVDVYAPKICVSVIGTAFEVQKGSRRAFSIFVGEDVKTQAGPDLKALIASHKQQAAYIDSLHEEIRRLNVPSYRPAVIQGAPDGPVGGSMTSRPPMQSSGMCAANAPQLAAGFPPPGGSFQHYPMANGSAPPRYNSTGEAVYATPQINPIPSSMAPLRA